MPPNRLRGPAGNGASPAGVSFQADARENTSPTYRTQGDLTVIAELEKNRRETLRIALDRYRGVDLLDLRVCIDLAESSRIQTPTKKGISIRIEQLPELLSALTDAEGEARRRGCCKVARPVAFDIADWCFASGLTGIALAKSLAERFPSARRAEAFLGLAIVVTDAATEHLLDQAEVDALKAEVAAVREAARTLPKVAA